MVEVEKEEESEVVEVQAMEIRQPTEMIQPLPVEQMIERVSQIKRISDAVMVDETHYGKIPGVKHKSLWLAGAEILDVAFQIYPTYSDKYEWHTEKLSGHLTVFSTCTMRHQGSQMPLAQATGVCSTLEPKYRWQTAKPKCPECGNETIFKSKHPPRDRPREKPGWFCWIKKGGCGKNFPATHDFGELGEVERDPAEVYNTVVAMAQKRAHIRACRNSTGASMVFTDSLPGDPGEQPEAPYSDQGPPPGWEDYGPPRQEQKPPRQAGDVSKPTTGSDDPKAGRPSSERKKSPEQWLREKAVRKDYAAMIRGIQKVLKQSDAAAPRVGDDHEDAKRARASFYMTVGRKKHDGSPGWNKEQVEEHATEHFAVSYTDFPLDLLEMLTILYAALPAPPPDGRKDPVTRETLDAIKKAMGQGKTYLDAKKQRAADIIGAPRWPQSLPKLTEEQGKRFLEWVEGAAPAAGKE